MLSPRHYCWDKKKHTLHTSVLSSFSDSPRFDTQKYKSANPALSTHSKLSHLPSSGSGFQQTHDYQVAPTECPQCFNQCRCTATWRPIYTSITHCNNYIINLTQCRGHGSIVIIKTQYTSFQDLHSMQIQTHYWWWIENKLSLNYSDHNKNASNKSLNHLYRTNENCFKISLKA